MQKLVVGKCYGHKVADIYEEMIDSLHFTNMETRRGFLSTMYYPNATPEGYTVWFIRYYNEWNKGEWRNDFNKDFSILNETKKQNGMPRVYSKNDEYRLIFLSFNGDYRFMGLYSVNIVDDYTVRYERVASVKEYPIM